ncbi:type IV secretion protein Rhs [Affinibrenneria salicis]|uniref:Type IV secretion protein Rhs n=1 Tax=Affinibrenneria salicis TaxID=2590031 RepID=A0A5J5FY52_9GAMM|nr:RHS repeat-associated core domain-containing protein [Affinibrenneria salicis]KAA8999056.1 type IV secretion protein Rhs [Affinibrenneria salicis]
MFEAARVDDPIGHSHAMAGMIAGTFVGGLLAAGGGFLASALFVAGLASGCLGIGIALVALSFAVGYVADKAATAARDGIAGAGAAAMSEKGKIITGSHNVFINGKAAAIATLSQVGCRDHGPSMQMAQGSSKVFINDYPAARVADKTNCDAGVMSGSDNVRIGGEPVTTLAITPEVPEWVYKASDLTMLFAGLVGVGGGVTKAGKLATLLGRLPGINKLGRVLCRAGTVMVAAAAAAIVARPVDVVSGQKFLDGEDELDFELPSRLPLRWQRYWRSGNPGDSVLGRGWSLPHESWLAPYQDGLVWRAPSGDYVSFPLVPAGYRTYCEAESRWLEHRPDGSWQLYGPDDERWCYPPLRGDSPSRVSRIIDATGNATDFVRDEAGQLTEAVDSAGQRIVCEYRTGDCGSRLIRVSLHTQDGPLTLVSYEYDDEGQLITVTGRGGSVARRFGWRDGLMVSHQDALGLLNEYRWQEIDGLPRVTGYRNSVGERLDIEYDFAGGSRIARRDDGAVMRWRVEDDDTVSSYTAPDGRQYALLYDDRADDERTGLCGVILPGGAVRRTRWDRLNRLTEESDAAGRSTRYQWWRNSDRLLAVTGPDGAGARSDYDSLGRLTAQTGPAGDVTRYHYPDEQESLPDSITDAGGGVVRLEWNALGMLTRYTDCSDSVTRYEYDRLGQLRSHIDAEGQVTRYEWRPDGRPSRIIRADGSDESFEWQAARLAAWRDPAGSVTRWQYNQLGLPVSVTDRIGRTLRYSYDPRGRLTLLDNGNGGRYRFGYDPEGRLAQEIRPDDTQYRLEYDQRGFAVRRLESGKAAPDGGLPLRVKQYQFDDAGLLTGYATEQATWHYRRDRAGRLSELTRTPLQSGIHAGISADRLQFRYDAAGRLVSEQGVNGELLAEYDALDNLTALTTPQGDRLQWLTYGSGHVSAVKFNQQLVSEFSRDRLHRETARSQGALTQQRGYDALGRRAWQSSGVLNGDGRITRPEAGLLWRVFRYTVRDELAGVNDALRGDIQYGYDAQGRLLSQNEARQGVHQRLRYDAADNLLDEDNPGPLSDNRLTQWQRLFSRYDAWGNLISRRSGSDEQHYRYDADNRLIEAHGSGPQGEFEAHYQYDAAGRRISKRVTTGQGPQRRTRETRFVWQGLRLLQVLHDDGTRRTYTYDPSEPYTPLAHVEQTGDASHGRRYWYGSDLNGAPLEVTDEEGALRWSGQYDEFGRVRHQTVESHALRRGQQVIDQPLRYAGQYADSETGLHYNLFRYYDPQCGRFTTLDPIGLAGGLNLYQYAPNALGWVDPLGLASRQNNGEYNIFHDYSLDPKYRYSSDSVQFNRANIDFINKMNSDLSFRRDMLGRHPALGDWLKNPNKASSPPGLTWHHHEDVNRLVLVDRIDHADNHGLYHPTGKGGRDMWGGGELGRRGKLDGVTGKPRRGKCG